jgi:hypothetical protein
VPGGYPSFLQDDDAVPIENRETMEETKAEEREPATRTLWVLGKDGHTMTCVISGEPGHEALRVLFDLEVYLDEMHTVHEGAVGRARTLFHGFEAHGWIPVPASTPPSPVQEPGAIE